MDIRLNRADCKPLYRLGTLGLAIALTPIGLAPIGLAPIVSAESPSDRNVVHEPVEPGQNWITEPVEPADLVIRPLSRPALHIRPEFTAEKPAPTPELPLLPPGPIATRTIADETIPEVATPRQIKPKRASEGVPANLARLQMQSPQQPVARPINTPSPPSLQSASVTKLRRDQYDVAIFESTQATAPSSRRPIQPSTVMPGFGAVSLREQAAKHLDESVARLGHRASLTAGAEATEALRLIAQAKDLAAQSSDSSAALEAALTALKEAEDFVDRYGTVDGNAITRMVRAHQTMVLKSFDCSQLTGASAADVYLDTSRRILAEMSSTDSLAAHAVACLAKSYRQRSSESRLALAASVHLMRAAVIAMPNDRELTEELASVLNQAELRQEAQHVLALSQRLMPRASEPVIGGPIIAVVSGVRLDSANGQATQAVRLEQLTPEAFSQLSRIESGPSGALSGHYASQTQSPAMTGTNHSQSAVALVATAPNKNAVAAPATESGVIENQVGNPFTRAVKSVTGMWK